MTGRGRPGSPWHPRASALNVPARARGVPDAQTCPRVAADGGELSCSHFDLPVTKSTTTYHFPGAPRESGVIGQVYRGTAKMSGLRRDDLDDLFPGLLDTLLTAAARQAARLGDG
ncbi:ArsR family transcriptional regulator [Streptomyces hygroscopicus]|uniref:transcriptional regulator n=1 Tax=Streptomyces hygroscopicus TaxID=1912 RepID=UPI003A0FE30C|nr:ArsR family transcriptional regulator [Streptomyces hygroscopicus]